MNNKRELELSNVRLDWPYLTERQKREDSTSEAQFRATLWIKGDDTTTLELVRKEAEKRSDELKPNCVKKNGTLREATYPLKKGEDSNYCREGYEDGWYMYTANRFPISLVASDGNGGWTYVKDPAEIKGLFYAGAVVDAIISLWIPSRAKGYNDKVLANLVALRKVADGEEWECSSVDRDPNTLFSDSRASADKPSKAVVVADSEEGGEDEDDLDLV